MRPGPSGRAPEGRPPGDAEAPPLEGDVLAPALLRALDAVGPEAWAIVNVPAPVAPAWAALPEAAPDATLLAPEGAPERAGWGVAARLVRAGAGRLEALDAALSVALARYASPSAGPPPLAFVGFAFEDEVDADWAAFGAAQAVLPRFAYVRDGAQAWLQIAVDPEAPRVELAREAERALARLRAAATGRVGRPPAGRLEVHDPGSFAEWRAGIDAARAKIRAGGLEKVVLSRRIGVRTSSAPGPRALAAALLDAPRTGTRFLFGARGSSFFGITPERLVRVEGLEVLSEALAGSRPAGEDPRGLLEDPKEREEHAHVVRHVTAALERVCAEVRAPSSPEPRSLGYVAHLHTPIRGTLSARRSALALAAALHPTPAVGGVPLEAARALIREAEPGARGWYTGGVGVVGSDGGGELWVALRSARLDGAAGHAFVGAGIVAASDPAREWAETEVKAQAVLGALGGA